jgi:hypothetical protein
MWGDWLEGGDQAAITYPPRYLLAFQTHQRTPQENLLFELDNVRSIAMNELTYFEHPETSLQDKRKRLSYLFVKDLLDGVHSMILDHKESKDMETRTYTTASAKAISCVFILIVCLAMLTYLYLFAMRQTAESQSAWLRSFLLWLFFEVFLVCTGLVLVEHVLIPLWSMRPVQSVKRKIAEVIYLPHTHTHYYCSVLPPFPYLLPSFLHLPHSFLSFLSAVVTHAPHYSYSIATPIRI